MSSTDKELLPPTGHPNIITCLAPQVLAQISCVGTKHLVTLELWCSKLFEEILTT